MVYQEESVKSLSTRL